jgi:hypothetical protein
MHSPKKALWWNKELSGLRVKTRRLFNAAKKTGHWTPIRRPSPVTTDKSGKSKRPHGAGTLRRLTMYQTVSALVKVMAKQVTRRVNIIKLPGGQYTQTERETLTEL